MFEPTKETEIAPNLSPEAAEIDRRLEAAAERMARETEQLAIHSALTKQQNAVLREHLERRRAFAARLEMIAADLRREQDTMNAESARLLSSEEAATVFAQTR